VETSNTSVALWALFW